MLYNSQHYPGPSRLLAVKAISWSDSHAIASSFILSRFHDVKVTSPSFTRVGFQSYGYWIVNSDVESWYVEKPSIGCCPD